MNGRSFDRRTGWLVALALVVGGCAGSGGGDDVAPDGGHASIDGGQPSIDGGQSIDAGTAVDGQAPTIDGSTATGATVIRIHYAAGSEHISVRGAGMPGGWTTDTATTAGASDTWTFSTTTLTATTEWKPLLGAAWSLGANYHVAPGQTIDVYPHFKIAKGTVARLTPTFTSTAIGGTRTVWVYLPPVYLENTAAHLPVMYMLDGQNLFDPSLSFGGVEWGVDETIDAAAGGGKCPDQKVCQSDGDCGGARCDSFREAIVIAPENGGASRIDEYTPTPDPAYNPSGGGSHTLDMLASELKPRIDAAYRTLPGAADTGIVGSSLGGLMAAFAGVTRSQVFGLDGIISPSTWWDNQVIISRVMAIGAQRPLRVYVDSGDAGDSMDDVTETTSLYNAFVALGYVPEQTVLHVVQHGGQHNETYWSQRLPGALKFLLGPRER